MLHVCKILFSECVPVRILAQLNKAKAMGGSFLGRERAGSRFLWTVCRTAAAAFSYFSIVGSLKAWPRRDRFLQRACGFLRRAGESFRPLPRPAQAWRLVASRMVSWREACIVDALFALPFQFSHMTKNGGVFMRCPPLLVLLSASPCVTIFFLKRIFFARGNCWKTYWKISTTWF